jgi:hypothetical protein
VSGISKERRDHYIVSHKDDILKAAYRFAVLEMHHAQWNGEGQCEIVDPKTAVEYAQYELRSVSVHAREWIRLLAAPVEEADVSPLDQVKAMAASARERAAEMEAEAEQQRALADALDAAAKSAKQAKGKAK